MMETKQKHKDVIGDILKAQEQMEAGRRAVRDKPLMARLDGKAFHTFTRGLRRPYDPRLSELMIDTTKFLVEKTHAKLGYCQSDEISLFWHNEDPLAESSYMFDGKYQKLTSVLASMAAAYFNVELRERIPEKQDAYPVFDCRVWNVDDMNDVYLNFKWRQDDAIKNSISMKAQAHFSAKTLHGIGSEEKKEMLRAISCPWEKEPDFFRWGSFVKRVNKLVALQEEARMAIPSKYRPEVGLLVARTLVEVVDLGYLGNKTSGTWLEV